MIVNGGILLSGAMGVSLCISLLFFWVLIVTQVGAHVQQVQGCVVPLWLMSEAAETALPMVQS